MNVRGIRQIGCKGKGEGNDGSGICVWGAGGEREGERETEETRLERAGLALKRSPRVVKGRSGRGGWEAA